MGNTLSSVSGGDNRKLKKEREEEIADALRTIEEILEQTTAEAKSKVARIAGVYRRLGKSLSESFKLAWADVKEYAKRGAETTDKILADMSGAASDAGESFAAGLTLGAAAGLARVKGVIAAACASFSVMLGQSLYRAESDLDDALGGAGEFVERFAEGASAAFGLAAADAERFAAAVAASLTSVGAGGDEAASLGIDFAKRAGEIAPLFDISQDDAFLMLNDALQGDADAAASLGVTLNDAALAEYAVSTGAKRAFEAMSPIEKALLRARYILDETSAAEDAAEASRAGFAAQTRTLTANLKSLVATLGQAAINIASPLLEALNALIICLRRAAESFLGFTRAIFGSRSGDADAAVEEISSVGEAADESASAVEEAAAANEKYLSGLDEIRRYPASDADAVVGVDKPSAGEEPSYVYKLDVDVPDIGTGIFGRMGEFLPSLTDTLRRAAHDLSEGFDSALREAFDMLSSYDAAPAARVFVTRFVKSLDKALSSAVAVGASFAEAVADGASSFLRSRRRSLGNLILYAFDVGGSLAESAAGLASDVGEVISKAGAGAAAKLTKTMLSMLTDTFASVFTLVSGRALFVIDGAVSVFEANRERIASALSGIFESAANAADELGGAVSYVSTDVLPLLGRAFDSLSERMSPVVDFITDAFMSAANDFLSPALVSLGDIQRSLTDLFSKLWEDVLVPFGSFLGEVFGTTVLLLSDILFDLWNNVLIPLGKFVRDVFAASWKAVSTAVSETMIPALSGIADVALLFWNKVMIPLATWLREMFSPTVSAVFESVGGIIDGLRRTLTGVLNFITSVFKGDWKSAWGSIKEVFCGVWDSLVDAVRIPINLIIGLINGMLDGIEDGVNFIIDAVNKLSFEVPDWIPGIGGKEFGFNLGHVTISEIPYLAKGAVIPPNAPFAAVLGDQRRGTNIEAPLDTIKDAVREVLAENGQGGENVYRFTAQIGRRVLFDEVITEARMRQSANGRNPFALA